MHWMLHEGALHEIVLVHDLTPWHSMSHEVAPVQVICPAHEPVPPQVTMQGTPDGH
jgi:hypothetical protein